MGSARCLARLPAQSGKRASGRVLSFERRRMNARASPKKKWFRPPPRRDEEIGRLLLVLSWRSSLLCGGAAAINGSRPKLTLSAHVGACADNGAKRAGERQERKTEKRLSMSMENEKRKTKFSLFRASFGLVTLDFFSTSRLLASESEKKKRFFFLASLHAFSSVLTRPALPLHPTSSEPKPPSTQYHGRRGLSEGARAAPDAVPDGIFGDSVFFVVVVLFILPLLCRAAPPRSSQALRLRARGARERVPRSIVCGRERRRRARRRRQEARASTGGRGSTPAAARRCRCR